MEDQLVFPGPDLRQADRGYGLVHVKSAGCKVNGLTVQGALTVCGFLKGQEAALQRRFR